MLYYSRCCTDDRIAICLSLFWEASQCTHNQSEQNSPPHSNLNRNKFMIEPIIIHKRLIIICNLSAPAELGRCVPCRSAWLPPGCSTGAMTVGWQEGCQWRSGDRVRGQVRPPACNQLLHRALVYYIPRRRSQSTYSVTIHMTKSKARSLHVGR